MKTNYHKRKVITHGDSTKHHHNPTGILVDMALRTLKYNMLMRKKNG